MKNIQKEHFDAQYAEGENRNRPHHLHNTVLQLITPYPVEPSHRILDIGAGRGELLGRIEAPCRKCAVDISPVAVEQLSAKGIESVQADLDVEPLPFDDASFDFVFCLEVIEHLVRPQQALQEIHRILKPDGLFAVSVPNIYQLLTPLLYLADIPPVNSARYGHLHVNDFTARVLKKALRENDFEIVRMAGDAIFPLTDPLSRAIARRIPRLAHHLIAICRKASTPVQ